MRMQVMAQTMMVVAIGLVIGLPASWMAARAIQGLLIGVMPTDPVTFAGGATLIVIVAALAGYVPATRASRIDPMMALRVD